MPRFVVTLDAPLLPGDALVRVPLALTGRWVRGAQEFSITLRDLEDIARNFQKRLNGEINVDYDHASEMPEVAAGGPIPSAGRIVRLDPPEPVSAFGAQDPRLGSKLGTPNPNPGRYILWGWYEPTVRARELIHTREYRYISPAIDWSARNKRTGKPQGTTLTSVALTNRPFLEEMPQIRLSDPAYQLVDDLAGEPASSAPPRREPRNHGGPMKNVTLSVADGKIQIMHPDWNEPYVAPPEDLKKCLEEIGLSAPTARADWPLGDASLEGQSSAATPFPAQPRLTLAQAGTLLSEADARGKSIPAEEFFRAQVERELDDALRAGKLLPRQRDDWRKIALSDLPTFRRLLAAQKPQVPLRPIGFSGAVPEDVQAQVKFLAEQKMREQRISFGQALTEIGREQPDLMHQYRRAVSGM